MRRGFRHNTETLCYERADDFFDLYNGYTTNAKVQDRGLVSNDVVRISLAHKAPAGTLDKVAMEMDAAAGALFTKKNRFGSTSGRQLKNDTRM
jgi:hypothetical protein